MHSPGVWGWLRNGQHRCDQTMVTVSPGFTETPVTSIIGKLNYFIAYSACVAITMRVSVCVLNSVPSMYHLVCVHWCVCVCRCMSVWLFESVSVCVGLSVCGAVCLYGVWQGVWHWIINSFFQEFNLCGYVLNRNIVSRCKIIHHWEDWRRVSPRNMRKIHYQTTTNAQLLIQSNISAVSFLFYLQFLSLSFRS